MYNPVAQFWRTWVTVAAPFVVLALPLTAEPSVEKAMWCAYCIIVMAIYWIFECVPLAITSLIPVVLLPLTGVMDTNKVCISYLKGTNMMFTAGLMMAIAVEHCGLHHRIALNIIKIIGTSRRLLMLGFMVCTMFLSMWISNTAATAMMVPIVEAIDDAVTSSSDDPEDIDKTKKTSSGSKSRNFLLLSCAYASNIGGTGVVTGSPPNLVVLSNLNKQFGDSKAPLSYASWMAFAVPLMAINTFLSWLWLCLLQKIYTRKEKQPTPEDEKRVRKVLMQKKKDLGTITWHEIQVLVLFIILILLWFFQSPKFIPGWADVFKTGQGIGDATPAVLMVLMIFIFPKDPSWRRSSEALIDWNTIEKKLPWGVILLLGGGFALSDATEQSGLSAYLAAQLGGLKSLEPWQTNVIIAVATTFITEVASNTATANILVPILMQMSLTLCINPIYLMMTCAISCSYAFMLPVATAPNAIVFSHSTMKTSDMMLAGFVMNLICIITTCISMETFGQPIYGLGAFPEWAVQNLSRDCLNSTSLLNTTSLTLPSPIAGAQ